MATIPIYNTLTTSTGSSTYDTTIRWYNTGTGTGTYINTSGPWRTSKPADHSWAISKKVTEKDLKAMKDEIRKYMKDQMLEDAQEIAGQLFEDVEKLKKEETQLKKSVTELKNQVEQVKADVKSELEDIEALLEKRTKQIIKFSNLDFS